MQASQTLPQIDCSKTLKAVILSPRSLARCNFFIWRFKRLINLSLAVGVIVTWLAPFVNLAVCRVLAAVGFATLIIPVTTAFLVMRFDIISLLLGTYEVWFVAINTVLSSVLLVLYMQDVERALLCFVTFLCYLYTVLVDARYSDLRSTTIAVASGALSVASMMIAVAFEALPGTTNIVLFTAKRCTLRARDVILNSLGIVFVLFVRSAYRRYKLRATASGFRVRVFSYRIRVKLDIVARDRVELNGRPKSQARPRPGRVLNQPATDPVASMERRATKSLTQLQYVRQETLFDSKAVVCWPVVETVTRLVPPRVLHFAAYTTIILCAVVPLLSWERHPWAWRLQRILTVVTVAYCGIGYAAHNRAMLRLLLHSFDVIYLLVNCTCAIVAAVYLVGWGSRQCAVAVASWCCAYWVVTVDALTPNVKAALGISRRLITVVLLYLLAAQVAVVTELVFQIAAATEDRVILSLRLSAQHRVEITAIPFLFARIFSVFWWTWRLFWRVCTQEANELLVIQGATEYEDYQLQRRLAKRKPQIANSVQVRPAAVVASRPR